MAHQGQLPHHLASCKIPQCAAFLYGKATKWPWQTRTPANKVTPTVVSDPRDCVSVNHLISSTPGLVAQIQGWLIRHWYAVTTVFVDHYSQLSFIYMQKGTTGEERLEAKRAFEAYSKSHRVTICHCHADNGRFMENTFVDHCDNNFNGNRKTPVTTRTLHLPALYNSQPTSHTVMQPRNDHCENNQQSVSFFVAHAHFQNSYLQPHSLATEFHLTCQILHQFHDPIQTPWIHSDKTHQEVHPDQAAMPIARHPARARHT